MKSWAEKLNSGKKPIVKKIDKTFAGIPAGAKMLISTPEEIDAYIRKIPPGQNIPPATMREALAKKHKAEYTCPVSTGIFLRIASEAAFENFEKTADLDSMCPFWRVVEVNSDLAKKLRCGQAFIKTRQREERE